MRRDVPGDRPTPAGRPPGAPATRRRARPRRAAALVVGLVLTGSLAACGAGSQAVAPSATPTAASAPAAPTPTPPPPGPAVPDVPVVDASLGASAPSAAAPLRLAVPDLDIDMAVDPVGVVEDGTMEIPEDADRAGWYRFGPAPADPEGATVVAAHVDSWTTGIGPFSRLRDVRPGARIEVTTADGVVHAYTVRDVTQVPKQDAPVAQWFDRTGAPRLVLVTCGGTFDRGIGHYSDNVAVTADPVAGTEGG